MIVFHKLSEAEFLNVVDNAGTHPDALAQLKHEAQRARKVEAEAFAVLKSVADARQPKILKLEPDGVELRVTLDLLDMGGLEILAVPPGTSGRVAELFNSDSQKTPPAR
jgi:hypothetical protein